MKTIIKIALLAVLSLSVATSVAQPINASLSEQSASTLTRNKVSKKKQIVTTQFVTNLTCEKCAKKIMNKIPFLKGVKDVKVDVKTKIVSVSYDKNKNNDLSIIEAFKKIDIDAKVKPAADNS